jgi:hypothetical protein
MDRNNKETGQKTGRNATKETKQEWKGTKLKKREWQCGKRRTKA